MKIKFEYFLERGICMKRKERNNISKKLGVFISASIMAVAITIPVMGATTYHYFFDGVSPTINSSSVVSTKNFDSNNEKHTIYLQASKITESGYVYAVRNKKGVFFWDQDKVFAFNITSTATPYSKTENTNLSGKYYYSLSNYDEYSNCSNADITFSNGYVKETS